MSNKNKLQSYKQNHVPGTRIETQVSGYSGPLPPPHYLKEYDEIIPGLAERIVKSFENQTEHRQKLEKRVITSNIIQSYTGQISATAITLIGMYFGFTAIMNNKEATGLGLIIANLATLVGTFIYGKKREKKDLDEHK